MRAARAETDRHAVLARDRESELATTLAERDRLRAEREAVTAELERLRTTIARLEREGQERVQQDRSTLDRLRGELDPLRSEADRLAALVRDRDAELEVVIRERDRVSVERESAKVEVGRLRMSMHQLEREHLDRGEQDRADLERLREENVRLRARIDPYEGPHSSSNPDEELRAAHARVASLQHELNNLRSLAREMRGMLAGIGIRFKEF